jgi:hypothetical protein
MNLLLGTYAGHLVGWDVTRVTAGAGAGAGAGPARVSARATLLRLEVFHFLFTSFSSMSVFLSLFGFVSPYPTSGTYQILEN